MYKTWLILYTIFYGFLNFKGESSLHYDFSFKNISFFGQTLEVLKKSYKTSV